MAINVYETNTYNVGIDGEIHLGSPSEPVSYMDTDNNIKIEIEIDPRGHLLIYEHLLNINVDLARIIAAYPPGSWKKVVDTRFQ